MVFPAGWMAKTKFWLLVTGSIVAVFIALSKVYDMVKAR